MNITIHRLIVAVSGQPDSMATPLPGYWGRSGGARVDTLRGCEGGCHQGDFGCDCELSGDVAPDASRTFRPMPRHRDYAALRMVLALVLIAFGCALLITAGCPPAVSP